MQLLAVACLTHSQYGGLDPKNVPGKYLWSDPELLILIPKADTFGGQTVPVGAEGFSPMEPIEPHRLQRAVTEL